MSWGIVVPVNVGGDPEIVLDANRDSRGDDREVRSDGDDPVSEDVLALHVTPEIEPSTRADDEHALWPWTGVEDLAVEYPVEDILRAQTTIECFAQGVLGETHRLVTSEQSLTAFPATGTLLLLPGLGPEPCHPSSLGRLPLPGLRRLA